MLSQPIRAVSLGAGSTVPQHRNVFSAVVECDGAQWLVGAREGVQRDLFRYELGLGLEGIVLTSGQKAEMLGLPGLLATLDHIGDRSRTLEIYVPPNAHFAVREVSNWFEEFAFTVTVHEYEPGEAVYHADDYAIHAIPNEGKKQSTGIAFTEQNVRGEFDEDKALEQGVPRGPKFGHLCDGEPVELADGTVITPDDVLGPAPPPRKLVFSGRTPVCDSVLEAGTDAGALVHDAGFGDQTQLSGNIRRPDTDDLGEVAARTDCDALLLAHLLTHCQARSDHALVSAVDVSTTQTAVFSEGTALRVDRDSVEISSVTPADDSRVSPTHGTTT